MAATATDWAMAICGISIRRKAAVMAATLPAARFSPMMVLTKKFN
jgi:hypothetical protein